MKDTIGEVFLSPLFFLSKKGILQSDVLHDFQGRAHWWLHNHYGEMLLYFCTYGVYFPPPPSVKEKKYRYGLGGSHVMPSLVGQPLDFFIEGLCD